MPDDLACIEDEMRRRIDEYDCEYITVHSSTLVKMMKANLIYPGAITGDPYYMGKRVVVDDRFLQATQSNSSYLDKPFPIGRSQASSANPFLGNNMTARARYLRDNGPEKTKIACKMAGLTNVFDRAWEPTGHSYKTGGYVPKAVINCPDPGCTCQSCTAGLLYCDRHQGKDIASLTVGSALRPMGNALVKRGKRRTWWQVLLIKCRWQLRAWRWQYGWGDWT